MTIWRQYIVLFYAKIIIGLSEPGMSRMHKMPVQKMSPSSQQFELQITRKNLKSPKKCWP